MMNCCICKRVVHGGDGHNAAPLVDGVCCRTCNECVVLPARVGLGDCPRGTMVRFSCEWKGEPVAMPWPRCGNGGVFYNPKSKEAAAFRAAVQESRVVGQTFGDQPVAVKIRFLMCRPLTHFKSRDRSRGLRSTAPVFHTAIPDVNNLVKFVLGGLQGLVFDEDSQVVQLGVSKEFDSEGECLGRTLVTVTAVEGH